MCRPYTPLEPRAPRSATARAFPTLVREFSSLVAAHVARAASTNAMRPGGGKGASERRAMCVCVCPTNSSCATTGVPRGPSGVVPFLQQDALRSAQASATRGGIASHSRRAYSRYNPCPLPSTGTQYPRNNSRSGDCLSTHVTARRHCSTHPARAMARRPSSPPCQQRTLTPTCTMMPLVLLGRRRLQRQARRQPPRPPHPSAPARLCRRLAQHGRAWAAWWPVHHPTPRCRRHRRSLGHKLHRQVVQQGVQRWPWRDRHQSQGRE